MKPKNVTIVENDKTRSTLVIIEARVPRPKRMTCAECKHHKWCMPFGSKGEAICHECAMKPENYERTAINATAQLVGDTEALQ